MKWKRAITERNLEVEAHRGFTESVAADVVQKWEALCVAWADAPFPKPAHVVNPFEIKSSGVYGAVSFDEGC